MSKSFNTLFKTNSEKFSNALPHVTISITIDLYWIQLELNALPHGTTILLKRKY